GRNVTGVQTCALPISERVAAMLDVDQGQQHRTVIGDLTRLDVIREVVRIAADCGTITAIVNAVGISPKNSGEKINFFDITPELRSEERRVGKKRGTTG